ncbi:MAG: hypothetical protein LQ348_001090 [Seirophora lacunosa]|nr:MAG: hypothetical protein LQ344_001489 [Seirophora lacunosa]KAI4206090.1 MAG: hypothetical protein LQ348_001090 [Seirophora lacunosa]
MASKQSLHLPMRPFYQCPKCRARPGRPRQNDLLPRSFTSTVFRPAIAAPPISFSSQENLPPPNVKNARVVPASPSYFSGRPDFTDNLLNLQALLRKYQTLPTVTSGQAPRVAWRTVSQYRLLVGEPVRASKYHQVVEILKRLNQIHPAVMPRELHQAMQIYKRDVNPYAVIKQPSVVDEDGRACGIGRRKSSSAKVYLVPGEGEVLVNGKSIINIFGRIHDRESALWALKATNRVDKYNVWALVSGGGTTGQAEALTLGTAKALMVHEPDLKPALRRAGCVTRDPRRVERKKPGKLKARKMPAWVKR